MHIYKANYKQCYICTTIYNKGFQLENSTVTFIKSALKIPCIKDFKSRAKWAPHSPSVIHLLETWYTSNIATPTPIGPLQAPIRPTYNLVSLAHFSACTGWCTVSREACPHTELTYILPRKPFKIPKTAT